jgi:hypothetical protein
MHSSVDLQHSVRRSPWIGVIQGAFYEQFRTVKPAQCQDQNRSDRSISGPSSNRKPEQAFARGIIVPSRRADRPPAGSRRGRAREHRARPIDRVRRFSSRAGSRGRFSSRAGSRKLCQWDTFKLVLALALLLEARIAGVEPFAAAFRAEPLKPVRRRQDPRVMMARGGFAALPDLVNSPQKLGFFGNCKPAGDPTNTPTGR